MGPNALEYITIKGFRSIASIEKFPVKPINIVIGANGSGKSNFIGAFEFLRQIREGRLRESVARSGGASRLLHFGRKRTQTMEFELSFRKGKNGYRILLVPTVADELAPKEEWAGFKGAAYDKGISLLLRGSDGEAGISAEFSQKTIPAWVRLLLQRCSVYHFHDTSASSPLRLQSRIDDNRSLRPDGRNLASFLYRLRKKHLSAYNDVVSAVRQVAPFFLDFQIEPLALKPDEVRLEWKHRSDDQYFDVASLSDGTLRFMAIATLLLQPPELLPFVILLDEPELGLHPFAIGLLASLIRQASKNVQMIVSTQSPLLIDYFDPEDVVVAELVDGATKLRRLESAPLRAWLEDFSLGQLWEKNELGGRP